MKKVVTILFLSTMIITQISSQEELEIEGSARIQQDLTIEGLAGNGTRNVIADTNGKLMIENKKQSIISISAASFLEVNNSSNNYSRKWEFFPMASNDFFIAPVQLPHGATLDSIKVYVIDNSIDNDLSIWFRRFKAETKTTTNLGLMSTNGTPSGPQRKYIPVTTEILSSAQVVDNSEWAYYFNLSANFEWDSLNLGVSNIHIYYTE